MKNRSILWYRQDLRIHDNEALYEAARWNNEVLPVYIFDPRVFMGKSRFGHSRIHPLRAQFIIESITALRKSWQELGSDLIVRIGKPEEEIFSLAREFKTSLVFCNRERTRDEVMVQDKLERNLWTIGQEMRLTRGKMLYYTQDLPFPVTHTPDNFTTFKKELERIVPVRAMLPVSDTLSAVHQSFDAGRIPVLADFGMQSDQMHITLFNGGEPAGIKKLKEYIWSENGLNKYKAKDNLIDNPLFSSSFSPWLAQGCLSPKMIYHEVKSYESIHGSREATQSLISELIRRDYCRLMAKKYGDKIFQKGGILNKPLPRAKEGTYLFNLWKEGRTGSPLIDASMQALKATGFLPHPLREAVGHFLITTLNVNWQWGADWFEANLIDYDPASNWVNWMVLAGQMPDTGEEKFASLNYIAKKYDPNGKYTRAWLKELQKLPDSKLFHPESLTVQEQKKYGLILGKHYPKPIIPAN
ncbi:MAG: DASH family cryptochrome [Saprospiraceae bacterium]|nr:DASH family cryptochrome [Saprospiraceae bacterium]